jgi:hypothetical protein
MAIAIRKELSIRAFAAHASDAIAKTTCEFLWKLHASSVLVIAEWRRRARIRNELTTFTGV